MNKEEPFILSESLVPISHLDFLCDIFSEINHPDFAQFIKYGKYPYYIIRRYGDGADSELIQKNFIQLLSMSGKEIYEKNFLKIHEWCCGVCHEILDTPGKQNICRKPSDCPWSRWNSLCVHSDNAMVLPFIDCMLYILLRGGLIHENEYITYVSWMLRLSKYLLNLDSMANYDLRPDKYEYYVHTIKNPLLNKLFTTSHMCIDELYNTSDCKSKKERNQKIQLMLATKMRLFLTAIIPFIREKMCQSFHYCLVNDSEIDSEIWTKNTEWGVIFFTQDPPMPPTQKVANVL